MTVAFASGFISSHVLHCILCCNNLHSRVLYIHDSLYYVLHSVRPILSSLWLITSCPISSSSNPATVASISVSRVILLCSEHTFHTPYALHMAIAFPGPTVKGKPHAKPASSLAFSNMVKCMYFGIREIWSLIPNLLFTSMWL